MKEAKGIVTKVTSTADNCWRLYIDFDRGMCDKDITDTINDQIIIHYEPKDEENG